MKLKDSFVTQNMGDTQVMVSTGETNFNGMVKSNQTAAFIIDCLKNETTKQEIVEKILEKYDVSVDVVDKDVDRVLDTLRKIDALEE